VTEVPMIRSWVRGIYRLLISLQLAVVLLILLSLSLVVATTLESRYDTATAQYFVYRAPWFAGLLLGLGINILSVALSRWPWKRRQIPFLMAHLGILLVLSGSWITRVKGLDGMLRIQEKDQASIVEVDEPQIVLQGAKETRVIPLAWRPPFVLFRPIHLPNGLVVEEFLSRADPQFSFVNNTSEQARPALQLKFSTKRAMGGMPAMAASQSLWVWDGADEWRQSDAGPAKIQLGGARPTVPGPWIWMNFSEKSGLEFEATSLRQEVSRGRIPLSDLQRGGAILDPGWKAVQIEIQQFVSRAVPLVEYVPAKLQFGAKAPPSAIRIRAPRRADNQPGESLWLGMGDRAAFETGSEKIQITYGPKRYLLPFALRLEQFLLERYPGSMQPASFSSKISVDRPGESPLSTIISMNEPLEWKGFTFYQSSYEESPGRPTASIFSVNQDPGRPWKYLGSLILVLGIIFFYVARAQKSNKAPAQRRVGAEVAT